MSFNRTRVFASGAVTLVLVVTVFGEMFVVMPRYRRFVEGVGVEPSLPARLAVNASRAGLLLVVATLAGTAAAFVLERRRRSGAFSMYLAVLSLVAAIYLALAAGALWDVMRLIDRVQ